MTILGTRPEIIRLSVIIKKLDKLVTHILVHTNQNYDKKLNDIFFQDLNLRLPDYNLGANASTTGEQIAIIIKEVEKLLSKHQPDRVLILGDTNSGLAAIIAARMNIPVYHMEAGNRCFDLKVPEEKNRKIIDAISWINLPYTPNSRENLIREGFPKDRIYISGNPIFEVLNTYKSKIEKSTILRDLDLTPQNFFLVTAHRSENVDIKERLEQIFKGLELVAHQFNIPIICSIHPHTKKKIENFKISVDNSLIKLCEPFSFFDFVKLEKNAKCVLTDSGTVQEECCIFHVPTVTVRDTTERPETVECGSNIISGLDATRILECTTIMINADKTWTEPIGYLDPHVSDKIITYLNSD